MKLVRFEEGGRIYPGVLIHDEKIIDVSSFFNDYSPDFFSHNGLEKLQNILTSKISECRILDKEFVTLSAPIPCPSKFICFGLNYKAHSQEFTQSAEKPTEPALFLKAPSAYCGPFDPVLIPLGVHKLDYEVELAVVIRQKGRYIDPISVDDYIAGYTVLCDFSERTMQLEMGGQWTKGKSHDSFAPLGPTLVTPEEFGDPQNKKLALSVNGTPRQSDNTASMMWGVKDLIIYASRFMTLMPGDVISTGSPAGVAMGRPEKDYLCAGDIVELSCEDIGTSRHIVTPTQLF